VAAVKGRRAQRLCRFCAAMVTTPSFRLRTLEAAVGKNRIVEYLLVGLKSGVVGNLKMVCKSWSL
jgi:hypothetical protein